MSTKKGKLIYRPNAGYSSIKHIDCIQNGERLTGILFDVLAMNRNSPLENSKLYAHSLANKFLNHAYTVFVLVKYERETNRPYLPVEISMLASIDVLVRALFEAYLTFYYLFIAPKTNEEKEFRYFKYVFSGYLERNKVVKEGLYPSFADGKIIIKDRKATMGFRKTLKANNLFQKLPKKEQDKVLAGQWKHESWTNIASESGFSHQAYTFVYNYLCGYAHSGSLSVRQLKLVLSTGQQFNSIDSLIVLLNICMAKMIKGYCFIFPSVEPYLNKNALIEFVNLWEKQAGTE